MSLLKKWTLNELGDQLLYRFSCRKKNVPSQQEMSLILLHISSGEPGAHNFWEPRDFRGAPEPFPLQSLDGNQLSAKLGIAKEAWAPVNTADMSG